ncbi:ras family domain-containing protein [Ditylenchus destructor]|uniref:Ras-related protein Rab-21 n=1 Tax=Ditylenchus destructor TaxID=166010 RepID=A0AAD4R3T1_9BILA|nr:ras family domain-containing protein [Ditylenchus destructor]
MSVPNTSPRSSREPSSFKVVLLGEGAVGKSSILLRYIHDKFNTEHLSTLQAAFATKQVVIDGRKVELNIWDTAGQEKFHALGPIYYRDSQGAILVYDITDARSFERVKNWVKELRSMLADTVNISIAGNKLDLEAARNVDRDVAEEYAKTVGAQFQECSAKENIGINPLIEELTRAIVEKKKEEIVESVERESTLRRHGSRRSLRIVDDSELRPPPKKGCC